MIPPATTTNPEWQPLLRLEESAPGDLCVFRFRNDACPDPAPCTRVLIPAELDRYRTFKSPDAAMQFLISRAAVRILLGHWLGLAPQAVPLSHTALGKPFIPNAPLQFNVSHTHGWGMVALSRRHPVGVDVERRRTLPRLKALAQRFLSSAEAARVLSEDTDERRHIAFFNIWTAKEACIKSLGLGLNATSSDFTTGIVIPGHYVPLIAPAHAPWNGCTTFELPMPHPYSAALALAGPQHPDARPPAPPTCYLLDPFSV